jgi:hypothetical protein
LKSRDHRTFLNGYLRCVLFEYTEGRRSLVRSRSVLQREPALLPGGTVFCWTNTGTTLECCLHLMASQKQFALPPVRCAKENPVDGASPACLNWWGFSFGRWARIASRSLDIPNVRHPLACIVPARSEHCNGDTRFQVTREAFEGRVCDDEAFCPL